MALVLDDVCNVSIPSELIALPTHIKVRQLKPSDWHAISKIAENTPAFTVPSEYVSWMLSISQVGLSWVCCDEDDEILGYLFCLRCSDAADALFAWQLGIRNMNPRCYYVVAVNLLTACVGHAVSIGIHRAYFTSRPSTTKFLSRCLQGVGCSAPESASVELLATPHIGDEVLYETILPEGVLE